MSVDEWQKEIVRRRQELCEKIGGKIVEKLERKKMPSGQIVERVKEVTEGGILHWGRETENKEDLEWFRKQIRKAYGGRAPKVLDPFAGGGAIPLEAMRLGCETTAMDINPVAWFILKCTMEYPQKLAGKAFPLPTFILKDEDFMDSFYKAHSYLIGRTKITKKQKAQFSLNLFLKDKKNSGRAPKADLAWHVRAWGQWVLNNSRRELARFYPTYSDFEPVDAMSRRAMASGGTPLLQYERQPMRLVPLKKDGTADIDKLNAEFSKEEYLADKRNPRWVAKTTVAYLWARTVKCKNCRATIPLLKTRWICKKEKKRILLTMEPNTERTGVIFGIEKDVPVKGSNTAQRREYDRRIGGGTMSRSGAKCPCCATIMTMEDIRFEGRAGRLDTINTAVVVDGQNGQEYRLPSELEVHMAERAQKMLSVLFGQLPFGLPKEPLASKEALGFRVPLYGFDKWYKLFSPRQLLALGTFLKWTRSIKNVLGEKYSAEWKEAVCSELAICLDKLADRQSELCRWDMGYTKVHSTFARFALPILWDFCQGNPLSDTTGNYRSCVEWVAETISHAANAGKEAPPAITRCTSAIKLSEMSEGSLDAIITDPPYYDAIPYSDLMDFFYIWLRRSLSGLSKCRRNP
jgi:adenine-specific DNA methylase